MLGTTALITGASTGIGREIAICCARDGHDLVLVARSQDKLERLASEMAEAHGVTACVVRQDLADPEGPSRVKRAVEEKGWKVDLLVNNAGFGYRGAFLEGDIDMQLEMLRLNVMSLTHLTHLFLPGMLERGHGRILNVASTAAFQPGPLMAVYYAAKAYVLSFSEALSEELRGSGVTVTALCPGPTESEFPNRAGTKGSRLLALGQAKTRPVAVAGYRGMMAGSAVVVPGLLNKLLAQSLRLTPRAIVRRIVHTINHVPEP